MSLVLASGSASRKSLLTAAGVDYVADPADLDEAALMDQLRADGANAERIAEELAAQKALHVSRRHVGALVLGGDSVIAFGDRLLSKCATLDEARALLARQHATYVVICARPDVGRGEASSFGYQLHHGQAPAWLEPVPVTGSQAFSVYRLKS